jgi:hypothetical protein
MNQVSDFPFLQISGIINKTVAANQKIGNAISGDSPVFWLKNRATGPLSIARFLTLSVKMYTNFVFSALKENLKKLTSCLFFVFQSL